MKKILLIVMVFLTITTFSFGQATNDYRSAGTGTWATLGTWERYNGATWVTPTAGEGTPNSGDGAIAIRNTHIVTVAAAVTVDQVTVESGGQVTINSGIALTVANGTGTDMSVSGTVQTNSTSGNGGFTINAGAALGFNSGGALNYTINGDVVPSATWDANSTLNITGVTSTIPTGLAGQTFGHFIWNVNQPGTEDLDVSFTVAGNMSFQNAGVGDLRLSNSGTNQTLTVNGNYTQSSGIFTLVSADGDATLNVDGDFTISGGTLDFFDGDLNDDGIPTLNVGGNFSHAAGTITRSVGTGPGVPAINFDGSSAQTLTGGGTTNGVVNYTINNSSSTGITVLAPYTITGTMTFTNGYVYSDNTNFLTIAAGGVVSGADDDSFVDGPIAKTGTTAFEFPVGNTTGSNPNNYHPISIGAPSASTTFKAQYIRANANSLESEKAPGVFGVSACEYWNLERTGAAATADVTLSWDGASPCGTLYITTTLGLIVAWRDPVDSRWENSQGTGQSTSSSFPHTTGTITRTSVPSDAFGAFTFGNTDANGSPLPVKFSNIKAFEKQSGVQIDWTTYQEENLSHYSVERSADGNNFVSIGQVASRNSAIETAYGLFDASPLPGVNFYRLRANDIDGKFSYSTIVKVNLDKRVKDISLYPNPATGGYISFQGADLAKGNYTVKIFNSAGVQVMGRSFSHSGGAINQTLQLPAGTRSGMYSLQLINENEKVMSKTFIVQ